MGRLPSAALPAHSWPKLPAPASPVGPPFPVRPHAHLPTDLPAHSPTDPGLLACSVPSAPPSVPDPQLWQEIVHNRVASLLQEAPPEEACQLSSVRNFLASF